MVAEWFCFFLGAGSLRFSMGVTVLKMAFVWGFCCFEVAGGL